MANFGPLTAEIGLEVWGTPANFNGFRVFASLLQRRRSLEANQTLHDVWPSPALVHYVFTFRGSWLLTEFCQFTLRSSLAFSSSGSVIAWHSSSEISQTLWRGTRNGITELSQRAPPIFGWAAITLGIGSHSSSDLFPGWNVASEIAKPQVCIKTNNSSIDCKKTATVNGNLQPEIEINEYSSSKKLLE